MQSCNTVHTMQPCGIACGMRRYSLRFRRDRHRFTRFGCVSYARTFTPHGKAKSSLARLRFSSIFYNPSCATLRSLAYTT